MPAAAPMPADALHETIEVDRADFYRSTGTDVRKYRDYANGQQQNTLTAPQREVLAGLLDNTFCDNVCHQIISEAADRVIFEGWAVEASPVADFIADLAVKNELAALSGEVHYAALRDGDFAVSLAWDNEQKRVTLHAEPWWDGRTGVYVAYDAFHNPLYAVKEWDTLEGRRRVVWLENRIERYIADKGGVWQPYTLPGENDHVQTWTKASGDALHIPVIHFRTGGRDFHNYGRSELYGGVLGFQDHLNDLQYDISAAARYTAYRIITATGTPKPRDEDGNDVDLQPYPGVVFHASEKDAQFGAIDAGDMSQLLDTYNAKLQAVCRMTRTPMHLITGGNWPSGEALLRAEKPLIGKCTRHISRFRGAWATVAHRASEIANTFGAASLDEGAIISATFAPPEQRDPMMLSSVIANVRQETSIKQRLRMLGYPKAQVDEIYAEIQEDKRLALTLANQFGATVQESGTIPAA